MDIKSTDIRSSLVTSKVKTEEKIKKDLEVKDKVDTSSSKGSDFIETMKETGNKVREWIGKHIIGDEPDKKTKAQMNKMMIIGATGGGVIGTVAGYALGYENSIKDKVSETWQTHDIKDPELQGWTHRDIEDGHTEAHHYYYYETVSHTDYNSDGTSYTYYTTEERCYTYYTYEHDGYWHRNDPNIQWTKVGQWQTPHLVHENSIGPLSGALIGLGTGAVGGGIIGAVCSHIFKLVRQHKNEGKEATV